MPFVLFGRLAGEISTAASEPLPNVAVRFYRSVSPPAEDDSSASGAAMLSREAVQAKEDRWIAQASTDAEGAFRVDLSGRTVVGLQSTEPYAGGPLEVDVYSRTPPALAAAADAREVQFTAARVQPQWTEEGDIQNARLEIVVPPELWRQVRTALDAWVLFGSVVRRSAGTPVEGVRVTAYDADIMMHDYLGSGVTDAEGKFRIEFHSSVFRGTGRGENRLERGPDVYFEIHDAEGGLLLAEDPARGQEPARRDLANLESVEILLDD